MAGSTMGERAVVASAASPLQDLAAEALFVSCHRMPRHFHLLLALITGPVAAAGELPAPAPRYIDDEKLMRSLDRAMLKLAEDGKATRGKELRSQLNRKSCDVLAAAPSAVVLEPEEIYTGCAGAVVMLCSAWKSDEGGGWETGEPATAWVVSPDGALVTNQHVFAEAEKEEVFGIMTHDGAFYPVTEILAADRLNDVAVFKVSARGLQPLALALEEPVGRKVCVISHPDRQFYSFTQGQISRYTVQYDEENGPGVKYMCITADYARGSSGGPVLNGQGAVVGMVCSTRTTYYGEKDKEKDNDVQMVAKFCIPAESIRPLLKHLPGFPPKATERDTPPRALPAIPVPPVPPTPPSSTPTAPPDPPVPRAEPVPEDSPVPTE
jgi:serine protease Do